MATTVIIKVIRFSPFAPYQHLPYMDLYSGRRDHRTNFEMEDILKNGARIIGKIAFIEKIGTVYLPNEGHLNFIVCYSFQGRPSVRKRRAQ